MNKDMLQFIKNLFTHKHDYKIPKIAYYRSGSYEAQCKCGEVWKFNSIFYEN